MPRYRFGDFIVSPRRRVLVQGRRERSLIPRYFDLLVFLIERRHEAVHRRDIFDRVWNDVIVSDSALSQAIRTIRRTLGDDSREPRYIRTVSRHGYRFVLPDVVEEDDGEEWPGGGGEDDVGESPPSGVGADPRVARKVQSTSEWPPAGVGADPRVGPSIPSRSEVAGNAANDPFEPLLQRLTGLPTGANDEEERREAAELLHALGTSEALRRLGTRPNHARARALLRDTRWDAPGAGPVPFVGQPAPIAAAAALVGLRLKRAARIVAARWAGAAVGAGVAGFVGGVTGGLILAAAPGSAAPVDVAAVLAVIGGCCGALGGAGVGGGLSAAEAIARSRRTLWLVCGAATGGGAVGLAVQWLGRWSLAALVGLHVQSGGGLEGLVIGGAAGLGYSAATARTEGGLAAPRGRRRLNAAAVVAAACGLGALGITLAGRPLVGGTVHMIAQASQGSQAMLTPLGRLIGEPGFGPVTSAIIGTGEGALFGFGLALGLTRRP